MLTILLALICSVATPCDAVCLSQRVVFAACDVTLTDNVSAAAIIARLQIGKLTRPMSRQVDKADKPMRLVMPSLPRLMRHMRPMRPIRLTRLILPTRPVKPPMLTRLMWPISLLMLTRPRPIRPTKPRPMKLTLRPMKPLRPLRPKRSRPL